MFQITGNIWVSSHRNCLFYSTGTANEFVTAKVVDRLLNDAT
jgi:hypothetical protein